MQREQVAHIESQRQAAKQQYLYKQIVRYVSYVEISWIKIAKIQASYQQVRKKFEQ